MNEDQIKEKLDKPANDSKKFSAMWRGLLTSAILLALSFGLGFAGLKIDVWIQRILTAGVVLGPFTYLIGVARMEAIVLSAISKVTSPLQANGGTDGD